MTFLYPFFISFTIISLAELGDKTQLLVLSFISKSKIQNILLGIILGSIISHGLAITFGSSLGYLQNDYILKTIKNSMYIIFIFIGIMGFVPKNSNSNNKNYFFKKISNGSLNYIFIIALFILVGEIGDKTFLTSLGLGIEYPNYKFPLLLGAVLGMVISNSLAIFFGKILEKYLSKKTISFISNIIFIIFVLIGFLI